MRKEKRRERMEEKGEGKGKRERREGWPEDRPANLGSGQ